MVDLASDVRHGLSGGLPESIRNLDSDMRHKHLYYYNGGKGAPS